MARIRTVKPDLFKHEQLHDAEREHGLPLRLAFIGLFTVADREGRFKWRPREIKLDVLPYDDNIDFAAVLGALCATGFVVHYQAEGEDYGYIPTFKKHQVVNTRETQSRLPDPDLDNVTHTHAPAMHVHAHGEGKGREGKGRELEGEEEHASQPKRAVVIAVRLRSAGIDGANASNPHLIEWAENPAVTDDMLDTAAQMAKARIARPGPNYLAPIILSLLNPPKAKPKPDDWQRSDAGIDRKADELGVKARAGENYQSLKARVFDEISRRERGNGAAA